MEAQPEFARGLIIEGGETRTEDASQVLERAHDRDDRKRSKIRSYLEGAENRAR
jgi:hypothetical protein